MNQPPKYRTLPLRYFIRKFHFYSEWFFSMNEEEAESEAGHWAFKNMLRYASIIEEESKLRSTFKKIIRQFLNLF